MWYTSARPSPRVLDGCEALAFRIGAAFLAQDILVAIEFDEPERGGHAFHRLEAPQRGAVLLAVTEALLKATVHPPAQTAVNEGCIDACFQILAESIYEEFEGPASAKRSRKIVRAACRELDICPPQAISDLATTGIEGLKGRILWDVDWLMEEILDMSPEQKEAECNRLNIDPEYFSDVGPSVPTGQIPQLQNLLNQFIASAFADAEKAYRGLN